ncbi:MAG TPA: GSU2403 family nucleotidyltransferase fold protein [Anaerolineae bacterium]|nr:GSU2403 family nucleotidyltransferase fold protein [Anaerolineae bacterium]
MHVVVDADPQLLATLAVLGDYLQDMVLVGGWVPHLYRRLWPSERPVEARRTFDLDAAVRGPLTVRHRSRLDVLLAAEGYTQILGGPSELAAQIYQSPPNSDLLPIEFLAPLTGRRQQATIQIQKGVTAQALRYLNILLENTFDVRLSPEAAAGSVGELTVRIPIPGAYVFHRGLIHPRGISRRRGKDLYYIFETWAGLPDVRDRIVTEIGQIRSLYPRAWYRRFRSNLENLFSSPAAQGVLLVFEQYEAQEPTDIAHQRIYQAFRALLGSLPND